MKQIFEKIPYGCFLAWRRSCYHPCWLVTLLCFQRLLREIDTKKRRVNFLDITISSPFHALWAVQANILTITRLKSMRKGPKVQKLKAMNIPFTAALNFPDYFSIRSLKSTTPMCPERWLRRLKGCIFKWSQPPLSTWILPPSLLFHRSSKLHAILTELTKVEQCNYNCTSWKSV